MLKIFFTLTFLSFSSTFAQTKFYSPLGDQVRTFQTYDCSFINHSCDDAIVDYIPKNATVWDCGSIDKNNECTGQKVEKKNRDGSPYSDKMSFVEYYYFNDVNVDVEKDKSVNACERNDDENGRSIKENANVILQHGIQNKQPYSKTMEQMDKYLNKKRIIPVYSKASGKLESQKVDLSDCFIHDRGWIFSSDLTDKKDKDPNERIIPSQEFLNTLDCDDCRGLRKKSLQDLQDSRQQLQKEIESWDKKNEKALATVVSKCDGVMELDSVSIRFQKTKTGCEITFPEGCEGEGRLQKMEEIANNILFTHAPDAEKKCKDAHDYFRDQCGLTPGLEKGAKGDRKDQQYQRFSDVKKLTEKVLSSDAYKSKAITPAIMMCIFNKETTTYDSSKLNYTVCESTDRSAGANMRERNKSGTRKRSSYIFKGISSSANGLGGVTLETACAAIRLYPNNYPELKNVKLDTCTAPRTKKLVEELFLRAGDDEGLQIRLAIDSLKLKVQSTDNVFNAIWSYLGGGDLGANKAYASAVTSCISCFNGKRSDASIHECIIHQRSKE
jgi:hypothetical protein